MNQDKTLSNIALNHMSRILKLLISLFMEAMTSESQSVKDSLCFLLYNFKMSHQDSYIWQKKTTGSWKLKTLSNGTKKLSAGSINGLALKPSILLSLRKYQPLNPIKSKPLNSFNNETNTHLYFCITAQYHA
jgi:hypothetical protein